MKTIRTADGKTREIITLSAEEMMSLKEWEWAGLNSETGNTKYDLYEDDVVSEDIERNSSDHSWTIIRNSDERFFRCRVTYGPDGLLKPEENEWTEVFEHTITKTLYW